MEIRKPKIKAMPYDEWKDNSTLEKMADELNNGGTNLVLGSLDQLINWGRRQLAMVAYIRNLLLWY